MEADWDEITRIAVPSSGLHAIPTPASALAFDDLQELLWVGNDQGRVTSFYGLELQRYVSVKAHLGEGPVKQLLVHEKGIVSISTSSVHFVTRRGLTQWHLSHRLMTDLRCMAFTSTNNLIIVAGCQSTFFIIDVDKGQIVSEHAAQARYTIIKKSRHICAATDDGNVHIISLNDFSVLKKWRAHSSAVNDMDARNDFLVTCGFSVRQLGVPIVDPLANVYDLKSLTSLPPIPFHAGAAYVRMHPKLQTTSFVASQTGQMQVVDLMNPVNVMLKQANVQFMLGMEIASSGDALAITDTNGLIYLWGSPSKARFNNISKETEFADPPPQQIPHVDWNDTPLNTIGMPYYSEPLLSAWPSHMVFEVGSPPVPVEPTLLFHMQTAEMGHYAPNLNPRKLLRYQVEDTRSGHAPASIAVPKFLSEKAKGTPTSMDGQKLSDAVESLAGVALNGRAQTDEERMLKYSNVEIKYSRFGVDDFDFRYYNKTPHSGLETHIANSFINSLLQLYRFIPLIRNVAIQHAATSCVAGNCLLCEFGFLFDMLEKAQGQNCQATNLLRAFGASREAANLGLFEHLSMANGTPLSTTIQAVNRFFLKQIAHEHNTIAGSSDGIDEILACNAFESIRCMYCNNETTKPASTYVHDLVYPQVDPKHSVRYLKFSSILKTTIEREAKNRGWCSRCRRYQQLAIRKTIRQLPFVLMINAALGGNATMRALWETPGWLPSEVGIIVQDRNVYCFEGSDLALHLRNKSPNLVVYELVGFVAEIDASERHQPHLVSMVNVEVSGTESEAMHNHKVFPNWHLFNDFLVTPVDPREALHFSEKWKTPSVIAYQVKSAHGKLDETWKQNMDTTLLYHHYSINGLFPVDECKILRPDEHPHEDTPIALDTEFVELEKAEIDVKADGTQETIRPAKSGLARVSVIRGQGDEEGVPFIDDYITIYEPIVDYKTQYSGIKPGDLDPQQSQHNLVPLKVAYKKLWILLNLGCIFVGHGLASDFRKANIHVPKSQTVDTQYLYLAPGRNRRFSLRYLAWAVFKEYIQEEMLDDAQGDGHDSIEDARMALRLWRKYQEYDDAGIVDQMIEDIYRKGTKYGWKPPPRSIGGTLLPEGVGTGAANSAVPSGRNTPELMPSLLPTSPPGSKSGGSTGAFKLNASGMQSFVPGNGIVRESPLR
ncbi:poly(A)-specific ribonuclease [Elasticomyces elasticus]|uniref:PAN2-PAN3 deadenylation complex catalytic subunit PAN2 n=1 Tax=Exophiala sideris TaxID=1016849 RepID=A0ABR0JF84_9EURO|nr:poly(A)-specific ribonuclease [Elasticomyces elasticus]KAK5025248.1 poly(A)-specific ribonuclease [Exophiala sideris]KAK5029204.1 poly(A)-specific ribonuclease [Exophiala sideris]KAK5063307.1 poly(A)-specific ribonuclease [Exophiala sideris]KAK5179023.1 poly(A)-specific ribonuclease [Eurotiomycetes sp. CCFEE 6388]